jgi:probable metal-binding protein
MPAMNAGPTNDPPAAAPADAPPRIHGHDVMRLLLEIGRPVSRDELETAIVARFGPEARFHTCSAQGMTAAEVVAFLGSRGKFVEVGARVTTDPARICSHE